MPSYIHSDRGSSFLSQELKAFLLQHNIASSRTTPYNPEGNGLVEKYNGTVWKAVTLALKSRKLLTSHWESVLPDALHTLRSLLCTSTNCTPHERLFNFTRNSSSGSSIPSWLTTPGKVLLKRHVRNSKHDPMVDEVELIEANPQYAFIRTEDGRETTVSTKHLAPYGERDVEFTNEVQTNNNQTKDVSPDNHNNINDESPSLMKSVEVGDSCQNDRDESIVENTEINEGCSLRWSDRVRHTPDRFVP